MANWEWGYSCMINDPFEPRFNLHSSSNNPFEKLATETIDEIFSYACDSSDGGWSSLDPSILLMVCQRWRAIATAKHSLWATITVNYPNIHKNEIGRLRLYLRKSGEHALHIHINGDENHDTTLSEILDILIPHCHRWRRVAFIFPLGPEFLQKLNTLEGRLPLLEDLDFKLSDDRYTESSVPCRVFHSAKKLAHLYIGASFGIHILQKIQIPWAQISEVTFSDSDFQCEEDLHEILGWLSVSLTSLTFSESLRLDSPTDRWVAEQSRKTTLPQLRRLCFSASTSGILDMLICPSLEELVINSGCVDTIINFLNRSSCALIGIEFWDVYDYDDSSTNYSTFLRHLSLSTLRSISLSGKTDTILNLLNFDLHDLLPLLETLHIYLDFKRHDDSQQHLMSHIEALQKIVDSRTRPVALDQPESLIDSHSSNIQLGARSSLKKCIFSFVLALDCHEVDDYWNESKEPLQMLWAFCISRNILLVQDVSHFWDYYEDYIALLNEGDDGPAEENQYSVPPLLDTESIHDILVDLIRRTATSSSIS